MTSTATRMTIVGLLASGMLAAQRKWTVDSHPSRGGDFLDIPPAIAAAAPGDIVIVRTPQGVYSSFTVDKGITIHVEGFWISRSAITIRDLPRDEELKITRFQGQEPLTVENCSGRVHLEGIDGVLTVRNSRFVTADHSFFVDALIERSYVWIQNSRLFGRQHFDSPTSAIGMPGLRTIESDVTVFQPQVVAALSLNTSPRDTAPGIDVIGGSLVIAGTYNGFNGYVTSGGLFVSGVAQPNGSAIRCVRGRVTVDSGLSLTHPGAPAFAGRGRFTVTDIHHMRQTSLSPTLPNGRLAIAVETTPHASVLIGLSLAIDRTPLPTPFGDYWLDTRGTIMFAQGTADASGWFRGSNSTPNLVPTNTLLNAQAIIVDSNGIQLSLPAFGYSWM